MCKCLISFSKSFFPYASIQWVFVELFDETLNRATQNKKLLGKEDRDQVLDKDQV